MTRFSYILIPPLRTFESTAEIRRAFALLKECGYEGVELNLTEPLGVERRELQAWIDDLGLVIPSFLTGEAYNDGLCLSSPEASAREGAVERLTGYLEIANQCNAILVVGLMQGLRSDEPDPVVANDRIADCLMRVAVAAEQCGVDIVIEPVNHLQVGFNNSVAEVLQLIERVGSPAIKPMVDTVHMNIEEQSLGDPILACGPELRHVHLCESNGRLFGTGNVDFTAVLEALDRINYGHFASVKVYRAPLEEAAPSSLRALEAAATS